MNRILIVIPARMASTRFPRKPLAMIAGKSMIERVWQIANAVQIEHDTIIATDDDELKTFAESFGATVMMTSNTCRTGTDRVAETAQKIEKPYDIIVGFQGDSVLTPPWFVNAVLKSMVEDASVQMATPIVRLSGDALMNFVKGKKEGSTTGTTAVFDKDHNALYFSKTLIPFARDGHYDLIYRHIGLYGYRYKTLQTLTQLPETPLEKIEKLEQLRALENGIAIRVVEVDSRGRTTASIDSPEDVAIAEKIIATEGELL